jgi:hypothetical protein
MLMDLRTKPTPKEYENFNGDIIFYSGADENFLLSYKMLCEFSTFRLLNADSLSELANINDHGRQIVVLYLSNFFTNDISVAVLVKGASNIAALTRNAYGTRPYEGKSFCTPCSNQDEHDLFQGEPFDVLDYVSKSELGGARHRYFFESAVMAWSRVEAEKISDAEMDDWVDDDMDNDGGQERDDRDERGERDEKDINVTVEREL